MFTTLDAEKTGVVTTNNYADHAMWDSRYHEFEVGAIGTGVTIGDYDGDDRPDLFVVSKTETSRLFRNLGNFRFEDVTTTAGIHDTGATPHYWTQGATFADVDNDGWLDLYLCRNSAPNRLYINQRDGTFREEAAARGLDLSDGSTMASFCDYDRDGWIDLYLQTNLLDNAVSPIGQDDHLYRNNGDGTFIDVSREAGIALGPTQGNSATWWDYNQDGWPDIYIANDFAVRDWLFRNNKDGTFTEVLDDVVPHTPYSSMGSDIGDINNDGWIDFLVTDMAASTHVKDQRTMAETRGRTADPANDSKEVPNYLWNALFINTGTDRMLEAAFLAGITATDWTWSVRFEDLDNDRLVDLHVTNGMHREIHNSDLLYRMMTAEAAEDRIRVARSGPILKEANLAYRNLGDLEFEEVGRQWGLDKFGVSFGAAFGDLDGDGDLDIVHGNYLAGATVLRNDSQTGHRVLIDLRGVASNRYGIGAVVRIETESGKQIRQLMLARGFFSSSEPVIHFGLGEDEVIQRLEVSWPSGHLQTYENLPANQRYTITESTTQNRPTGDPASKPAAQFSEVSEETNLSWRSREAIIDEIAQQRLLPRRLNRLGPALAAGDLTGSGDDDILVGGTMVESAHILLNTGNAQFTPANDPSKNSAKPVNDGPILLFDADADGRTDILATKGGNSLPVGSPEYQPKLFLNTGEGIKNAPEGMMPAMPLVVGAAVAADFDRDGRLDVFLGGRAVPGFYPEPARSVLLANRGDRFEDVTKSIAPALQEIGMVTAALWSDVDNDGWLDLCLTLEWGHVKCFRNNEGRGFEDWTIESGFVTAGTGWWDAITATDLNNDGRPDYVIGNAGLNTRFRANASEPALLFYGEFRRGRSPIPIEAKYDNGDIVPLRSRKELSAAIPSIKRQFRQNDLFAESTLEEIVGQEPLAAAQRFEATELRSGALMSQADGGFEFQALPRIAQIAPIQGLVVGDFNGDGNSDVCAVQNSYAPSPVTGRFDGGLGQLLLGDGRGGLEPVRPLVSGIVVPGDANALVVTDFNGDHWPDLIASRSHSTTLAFRNEGSAGGTPLAISLHGPAGNPTAIGARVTLAHANGTRQTSEVYAGSGYWSQSSATLFFGYTDENPAHVVRVRWPDGRETETPVDSGANVLAIAAPSP